MKKQNSFVWERFDQKTIEYCSVNFDDVISINSYITGLVNDIPLHINYTLTINKNWQIKSFTIKSVTDTIKTISLSRREDNQWIDEKGNVKNEFNECADIDISLTPLTNTLPIRRLSLPENHSQTISVLYINLPSGNLKSVKQRYTNLGNNKYLYESLDSGFKAEIDINDEGFVTQYSKYWKLINK